jgi:hypothetical protein
MTKFDPQQAIQLIDDFAVAVDFRRGTIEHFGNAPEVPDASHLWTSEYAQILAVYSHLTEFDIRQNVRNGQEWLDVLCMNREQEFGNVVDAYLVILLNEEPSKQLQGIVREIELDPTACRKHFVWPSNAEDQELRWSRIFRITVLGLPPSPESSGMTNTPKLHDRTQIEVLDDIKNLKPANAARKHGEQVRPAPRR